MAAYRVVYGSVVESVVGWVCVVCYVLRDSFFLCIHVYAATYRYIAVHFPDVGGVVAG